MPGSTPGLAIPYALTADQLTDWPGTNQSMSQRIEDLFNQQAGNTGPAGGSGPIGPTGPTGASQPEVDTGWVNMTPVSGTGTCRYRCRNGVVTVSIWLTGITGIASNTSANIVAAGVLPAAYRPSVAVYQAGSSAGSGMSLGVINTPDGNISLWNPSYNTGSMTVARVTFTYLQE